MPRAAAGGGWAGGSVPALLLLRCAVLRFSVLRSASCAALEVQLGCALQSRPALGVALAGRTGQRALRQQWAPHPAPPLPPGTVLARTKTERQPAAFCAALRLPGRQVWRRSQAREEGQEGEEEGRRLALCRQAGRPGQGSNRERGAGSRGPGVMNRAGRPGGGAAALLRWGLLLWQAGSQRTAAAAGALGSARAPAVLALLPGHWQPASAGQAGELSCAGPAPLLGAALAEEGGEEPAEDEPAPKKEKKKKKKGGDFEAAFAGACLLGSSPSFRPHGAGCPEQLAECAAAAAAAAAAAIRAACGGASWCCSSPGPSGLWSLPARGSIIQAPRSCPLCLQPWLWMMRGQQRARARAGQAKTTWRRRSRAARRNPRRRRRPTWWVYTRLCHAFVFASPRGSRSLAHSGQLVQHLI